MPSLTLEEIQQYCIKKPNIFVETGTYMGDTVNNVLSNFNKIYSIELSPNYSILAENRFKKYKHVSIVNGDSSKLLNHICKLINEPVFFWLDGHWSGGDTAQGSKDCPLLEELKAINENLKSDCIIAIDDVRLFGTHINENWLDITRQKILDIVTDRVISCKYYPSHLNPEDRMVIHLKPVN
jgi:hypothetical protein